MVRFVILITILISSICNVALAANIGTGRAEFLATMFNKYVNNKSFANLYYDLNASLPKDSLKFIKDDMIKNNEIITSKVNGSDVTLNDILIIHFQENGSVKINKNNQVFTYDDSKTFKENYELVKVLFSTQKTLINLFIPQANAFFEPMTTAITIAIAAAVVVVGTVVLVGNEIFQACKDGTVICEGNAFVFRSKTRNFIKWASTDSVYLKPADASKILNENVEKCDEHVAEKLSNLIRKNLETKAAKAKSDVEKAKVDLKKAEEKQEKANDGKESIESMIKSAH